MKKRIQIMEGIDMKIDALIPARGGSKGIPRKNIQELGGKPLIAWTIEAALKSDSIRRVIVSTDDEEIAEVAKQYGAEVPALRPSKLAEDDTPSIEVIHHALENWTDCDALILLQPTSPFRNDQHIEEAIELFKKNTDCYIVSVHENDQPLEWMFYQDQNNLLHPIIENQVHRRQLAEILYILNGAIYIGKREIFRDVEKKSKIPYILEQKYALDIDTIIDLKYAQFILDNENSK